jgi:cyclopropane fatty-acyl-phospholipid synthase-like methyltransferase
MKKKWNRFTRFCSRSLQVKSFESDLGTFLEKCKDQGVRAILEFGSGDGSVTKMLLEAGYEVTAIDICSDALDTLQEDVRKRELPPVSTLCADFTRLSADDLPRVDAVVAVRSINHCNYDEMCSVVRLITSTLANGGLFFLYTLSFSDFRRHFAQQMGDCERTYILSDGVESGIPHTFLCEQALASLLKGFEVLHRSTDEYAVPRRTRYFDSYSDKSKQLMEERNMLSSHHCVVAKWQTDEPKE